MADTMVPCAGCGTDLTEHDARETTTMVDAADGLPFSGVQREVPALVCPLCRVVTPK